MSTAKQTVAISTGDHKQAALFFDLVWPLHSMDAVPDEIHDLNVSVPPLSDNPTDAHSDLFARLIMTVSKSPLDSISFKGPEFALLHHLMSETYKGIYSESPDSQYPLAPIRDIVAALLYEFMIMQGYNAIPILDSMEMQNRLFEKGGLLERRILSDQRSLSDALEINVTNLKLIIGDNAEWQQIKEARTDTESIRKIRNLRILFNDKYKDKDPEYIKDDIDRRMDEYEEACKKHGFEMKTSALSSFLDAKSLIGLSAIAAASSMVGIPAAPTVAAISGAVLHTSKVIVDLRAKQYQFTSNLQNNEIAYVVDAKRKIANPFLQGLKKRWFQFWRRR